MFKNILWSDYFERTLVWTMVWNSSGQWSGTCLIRGHFGLELAWSEAASSALRAHNDLRAHSRLIRGHFDLGRSDQRSHLSGTVWSEAISSATSTWAVCITQVGVIGGCLYRTLTWEAPGLTFKRNIDCLM